MEPQAAVALAGESLTLVERLIRHFHKPNPVAAEIFYDKKQSDPSRITGEVRLRVSDPTLEFVRIQDLGFRSRVGTSQGDDFNPSCYATLAESGFWRMLTTARIGSDKGPRVTSPSKQDIVLRCGETARFHFDIDLRMVARGLYPPTSDWADIPKERLLRDAYTRLFLDPHVSVHVGGSIISPNGKSHHYRATNSESIPSAQFELTGSGPKTTSGVRIMDLAVQAIGRGHGTGSLAGLNTRIPPITATPSVAMLDSAFADEITSISEQLVDTYRDLYLNDRDEESWVCEQTEWLYALHTAIRDRAEIHGVEHRKLPFTRYDTVDIARDGFRVIVDGEVGSDKVESGLPPKVTGISVFVRSNSKMLDRQHTANVDGWERVGRWVNGFPELSVPLCRTASTIENRVEILKRFDECMARLHLDCQSMLDYDQVDSTACPCDTKDIEFSTFAAPGQSGYDDQAPPRPLSQPKACRRGPAP